MNYDVYFCIHIYLVKEIRWSLITKIFNDDQVSILRDIIDAGATVDQISDSLLKFGSITKTNREDAILYVFTMLLKGKNRNKRISCVNGVKVEYLLKIFFTFCSQGIEMGLDQSTFRWCSNQKPAKCY